MPSRPCGGLATSSPITVGTSLSSSRDSSSASTLVFCVLERVEATSPEAFTTSASSTGDSLLLVTDGHPLEPLPDECVVQAGGGEPHQGGTIVGMPTVATRPRPHPVFARVYARLVPQMDEQGAREHRHQLLKGLSGSVLEVGAGDGANFPLYPSSVQEVLAVEPEPYLRARAVDRAATIERIGVVDGDAEHLPVEDGWADAVVFSLVLCSVPHQARALCEAARVLKVGGALRFYEHVAAPPGRLLRVQRLADATLWPRLLGGCHTARDTVAAIASAGFELQQVDRFEFPPGRPSPARPHVLGSAVRLPRGP